MMTKEQVAERIEKKHKEIEKINKRIVKWSVGLTKEELDIAKEFGMMHYEHPLKKETREKFMIFVKNPKNPDSEIYELANAYSDLRDAQLTLAKYEVQMTEIVNFENEDKIEVLVEFLKQWREHAYNWYMTNAQEYLKLRANEKQELEKYLQEQEEKAGKKFQFREKYYHERQFEKEYYREINSFTKEFTGYSKIDTAMLNKVLDDEVVAKYKDLVLRITNVVGEIQDVSNLSIGNKNGEINGTVKGSKGTAKVETISAGGYHIQVFHYRVLVHKVK